MKLVLTCEHAFNSIPEDYKYLFRRAEAVLNSHRGFDPGAYDLFLFLKELSDFNFHQKTGRLLVEVNRSKNHSSLFSEFTKNLSSEEKTEILKVLDILKRAGLPTSFKNLSIDEIYEHMLNDKKSENKKLKFILPKAIGEVVQVALDDEALIKTVLGEISEM